MTATPLATETPHARETPSATQMPRVTETQRVTEAPSGAPPGAFSPVADVVFESFGAQRVMFGSDWPVCLLARDYAGVVQLAQLLAASLSDAERSAVFNSTAVRLYGIGEPPLDADGDRGSGDGSWR